MFFCFFWEWIWTLEGLRFPELTWRCCWTLIRLSPRVLLSSLTFTLSAAASQGLGVKMGPVRVMRGWARTRNITGVTPLFPVPPPTLLSQGSTGSVELRDGGRTSQGTQLRSDIPSLGLRSCCSFRPNTNSAEGLEVSQHARTHTASTVVLLCLIPFDIKEHYSRGVRCPKCWINHSLNGNHPDFHFFHSLFVSLAWRF